MSDYSAEAKMWDQNVGPGDKKGISRPKFDLAPSYITHFSSVYIIERKGWAWAMEYGGGEREPITSIWGGAPSRAPDQCVRGSEALWSWKLWSICAPKGRPKTLLSVRQDRLNINPGSSPRRLPLRIPASKKEQVTPCACPWAFMVRTFLVSAFSVTRCTNEQLVINFTRLCDIVNWSSLLVRHESDHREDDEPREQAGCAVDARNDERVPVDHRCWNV